MPALQIASMGACVPRPAQSHAAPGPHGEAEQPCPHVASPPHGTMGMACTRTVMGLGQVQVSMGACMSVAARKAPAWAQAATNLARAVLSSPGSSVGGMISHGAGARGSPQSHH